MKKKVIMLIMAAVLSLSSAVPVFAAPKTMADGTVFDAEYYAKNNPDVVTALGTDENALYKHYVTFGKNEGRLPFGDLNESFFIPNDKYYLIAGWVQIGYGYEPGRYDDPSLYFVRGDYRSKKLYQDLKADFLAKLNANGGKIELVDDIYSDVTFPYSDENCLIVENLAVDLQKMGIVDSCYFFNFDYDNYTNGYCNPSRESRYGRKCILHYIANVHNVGPWTLEERPELIPYCK